MDSFLTPIRIPRLEDPTFQAQFDNFCRAIRDNFDKIISVQFTKGERGSSIINKTAPVFVNNKLTKLGASFLNGIFMPEEINQFEPNISESEIKTKVDALAPPLVPGDDHSAIDFNIFKTLKLDIFVDVEGGHCYMSTPYIFIDNRINDLRNLFEDEQFEDDTIYRLFNDFSCSFIAHANYYVNNTPSTDNVEDYGNWDWAGVVNQIVPKLYFDSEINEFCWKVNGQETHITAQGLKGEPGTSSLCHVCRGELEGAYITITEAQYIKNSAINPEQHWHRYGSDTGGDEYNAYDIIQDKDLVLCYYDDPITPGNSNDGTRRRAFLGQAIKFNPDNKKLYRGQRDPDDPCEDIFYSIANQSLKNLLYTIGPWSDEQHPSGPTENAIRGLFIKGYNTSNNDNTLHMLYAWRENEEDPGKLRITPVNRSEALNWNKDPLTYICSQLIDFIIDYNIYINGNVNITQELNVQGNTQLQGNMVVQGNTQLQGNMVVQGNTQLQGNMVVQGNSVVQGNTIVNNLTVQGVFNQTGIIGTSLSIGGDFLYSVNNQTQGQGQPSQSSSKFARACVSQINNIKTYVSAVKLRSQQGPGDRPTSEDGSFPDIPLRWDDFGSGATHLAYIGITFNLRLIIGYAGYGDSITKKDAYHRKIEYNQQSPSSPNTGSIDEWQNMNLYNAREYNIPCYIYKQFSIKGEHEQVTGENNTETYKDTTKIWDNNANAWTDDLYVLFSQQADPIVFDGIQFTPKICFNVLLTSKTIDSPDQTDQNDTETEETTPYRNFKLGVIFYQGVVETAPNRGFYMNLNSGLNSENQITSSNMPCLYSTTNNGDNSYIDKFVTIFPYQICESAKIPVPFSSAPLNYMITNQQNLYLGVQGNNSLNDADLRKSYYKRYVKEVALPRMCAIAAGILEMNTYRTPGPILDDYTYTYTNEYNETVARPQKYISFFINRKAKYYPDSKKLSIDCINDSFDVHRIFKFNNNMDVLDGNANVYSKSLVNEDPHIQMIQRMIDADQPIVGMTSQTGVTDQHWNDVDIMEQNYISTR